MIIDGSGIQKTPRKHHASWHKSCRDKRSNRSLKRLKRAAEKLKADNTSSLSSPVKLRRSDETKISTKYSCFFCGKSSGHLNKESTFGLDYKARRAATLLSDRDVQYHVKCLQVVYNRVENKAAYGGNAFAELVSYIQSFENDHTTAPVFHMSKLCSLYQA